MNEQSTMMSAVWNELKQALRTLRLTGETYTMYVETSGLTQGEQVALLESLGRGDVTVTFAETDQPVEWYETQIKGIWIGTFKNGRDESILYTVEVCRYPTLAQAYDEDMESGEEVLQSWIDRDFT